MRDCHHRRWYSDFRRLSDVLLRRTGWQVVAVPGLVPDEIFFEHLAHRRFPAGSFIRKPGQLDYLEEPDVFHDVFGHVPMLMNPAIADYIQAYGEGGLRAQKLGVLGNLARVYWYTVEFGLVEQRGGLRIYGSGIASSYTESVFALDDPSPNRIRFELERVMPPLSNRRDLRETYFVLRNRRSLELARTISARCMIVRALQDYQPGDAAAGCRDHRGTGRYHRDKRHGH
jgi:phenylalanine-4-hydroxylase